jgi:uncharacterized membrane protein
MQTVHRFGLAGLLVASGAVASLVFAPSLPSDLVVNWDASGQPGETMGKTAALWLLPAIAAGLVFVFAVIPRIDPLRQNIASFRPFYDWFVVVLSAFLVFVHAGMIAFNLGYEFPFTSLVVLGTALLLYYVGALLSRAERNWFVGIRTPWTLSSDEVWRRTHDVGGTLFKLTAIISAVGALFGEYAVYFLLVPLVLTAVSTAAYSYYLYERLERDDP